MVVHVTTLTLSGVDVVPAENPVFAAAGGKVRFAPDRPVEILVSAGPHVIHARRDGASGLRYGRFDDASATVSFTKSVGDNTVFATNDEPWTVWTDGTSRAFSGARLIQSLA